MSRHTSPPGSIPVPHAQGERARGPIHVNTLEAFYALMKRGLLTCTMPSAPRACDGMQESSTFTGTAVTLTEEMLPKAPAAFRKRMEALTSSLDRIQRAASQILRAIEAGG